MQNKSFFLTPIILGLFIFLISCDNSEYQGKIEENKELKSRVQQLEKDKDSLLFIIEKLSNSPEKLFREGTKLSQKGNYEDALKELNKIVEWYPSSEMISKTNLEIKRITKIIRLSS